ncbi:MAG: extracellular solute-binding protein, partial [Anaerolineae bacterium]|nr:extracellular solute-binding protein [Anaerolineae bacterium]
MLSACSQTPVEQPAPSVEEAGAVTIKVQGPGNETQYELDQKLAAEFTAETGINVEVVRGPDSTTDRLNEYLVLLGNEVSEFDVYQIDVIWPGILADHMVNLNEALSEEAATHFPAIIENNTVDGHLVGMPWYTDAGMLYYRTDLLEKYGFDGPPETWDE